MSVLYFSHQVKEHLKKEPEELKMKKLTAILASVLLLSSLSVFAHAEENIIELDPMYNVPTEELLERFPIEYETPAETEMAKKIQNRMLNGFNTWNLGYDAWEHWGEVLYSEDSIYNVHGAHLTLKEYQDAMNMSLQATDIQMGQFRNMILSDDWAAIRYDTSMTNRQTGETSYSPVTEFVRFKDFGERGAKVDEGWGGVRDFNLQGMMYFMTEEEQAYQKQLDDAILNIVLPETDDLEVKYPVTYPTEISTDMAKEIKSAVLQEFEAWNNGTWSDWADQYCTADIEYSLGNTEMTVEEAKTAVSRMISDLNVQRVRLDNLIVSEDWAGIHYWNVISDEDGVRTPMDTMTFMHFVDTDEGIKVDICSVYQGF